MVDIEKVCGSCSESKSVDMFHRRGRDGYQSMCKQCRTAYHSNYYQKNKNKFRVAAKERRDGLRAKLWEYKSLRSCTDCGNSFHPYAMEFDHIDPSQKVRDISALVLNYCWNWDKILTEIAKCELVCAICHRVRTYNRLNAGMV